MRNDLAVDVRLPHPAGDQLRVLRAEVDDEYGARFGVDIELLGPYGFLALTPKELIAGINLSTVILIVHGWLYVLYLACDFLLWRYIRWSFARFLFIALGGIIPLLSFFLERQVPRQAEAAIASIEKATA